MSSHSASSPLNSPFPSDDEHETGGSVGGEQENPSPVPGTPRSVGDDDDIPGTPGPSALWENEENPSTPLTPIAGLDDDDEEQNHGTPESGLPSESPNMETDEGDQYFNEDILNDTTTRARGTNLDLRVAAETFRSFFREFQPSETQNGDDDSDAESESPREDEPEPFYLKKLRSMLHHTATSSLDIDTMDLYFHNEDCRRLYHQLVQYPMEIVPLMDLVVQRELRRLLGDGSIPLPTVQVRPFNLKEVSNLRCLDPVSMDSLVCLKGMIVRCSPIIPDLKVAHFVCSSCGNSHQVAIDRGRIHEPGQCNVCNTKDTYQIVHNRSLFADKQLVRLQETPDQVPAGQTPASVTTFCFDDLVDKCQPGDRVEVTGILRAQPVRVNPRMSKLKSLYKTYIDVVHFQSVTGMETTKGKTGVGRLTTQRIEELKDLSQAPDIYDKLTKSLAPSIWRLDDVKKGILCMLFGGSQASIDDSRNVDQDSDQCSSDEPVKSGPVSRQAKRGDVNILLCGDPGTSKSQLLSYVHKLSSRGIYTSGKGSSAVGLTASVVRDPETRDLVLESGALVLSDKGVCCIDEFDKMTDTTRSILHEAMEQQTVSIAKAGIIASLNARTSILASANPTESRYNPSLSVVDNIKLPPTLLSRFDLIYLILDSPNPEEDRQLAQHLVGLYYENPSVVLPPLDTDLLRDYIDYARNKINPVLSDEATKQLLESYLELRNPPGRNAGENGSRTISATPRQLESLIRTSEALAKMRFSTVVTRNDANEALRLLKVATQAAATDPRTGRIDMDMISTGRTSVARETEERLYADIKEFLFQRRGQRLAVRDVSQQLSQVVDSVEHDELLTALRRMVVDGLIQFNERAQSIFVRTGMAF